MRVEGEGRRKGEGGGEYHYSDDSGMLQLTSLSAKVVRSAKRASERASKRGRARGRKSMRMENYDVARGGEGDARHSRDASRRT